MEYIDGGDACLALGAGIQASDVWVKAADGLPVDFRFRIERRRDGVDLCLDQGGRDRPLWTPENAPRLHLTVDPDLRSLTITFRLGQITQSQEVKLENEK